MKDTRSRCLVFTSPMAAVLLLAALLACAALGPSCSIARSRIQQVASPARVATPKVVTGAGFLTRSVFLSDPRVGDVTDLRWGEHLMATGTCLCVAGGQGALYADGKGTVLSFTPFASLESRVSIIEPPGQPTCEFLNRGSWATKAALLNHDGKVVWSYGGMPGVDDTAAGDLHGDGKLEFVVGFNGGGGVRLLDSEGKQIWRKSDGNVWHVAIAALDGASRPEIIHSCAEGQMVIRYASGSVLQRYRVPTYFSQFVVSPWPDEKGDLRVVCAGEGHVWVLDSAGRTVAELPAPGCGDLNDIQAVPVKIEAGQPSFFAVVLSYSNESRSVLYIYDANRALVYQETIGEPCGAMTAMPVGGGAEALLVGGRGRVWEYLASGKNAAAKAGDGSARGSED